MQGQAIAQTPAIAPTSEQGPPKLGSLLLHFKAQGFSLTSFRAGLGCVHWLWWIWGHSKTSSPVGNLETPGSLL